jgi:hypothetical protein
MKLCRYLKGTRGAFISWLAPTLKMQAVHPSEMLVPNTRPHGIVTLKVII